MSTDKQTETDGQREPETYEPPADVVEGAHIKDYEALYARSMEDTEGFWAEQAQELSWHKEWDQIGRASCRERV